MNFRILHPAHSVRAKFFFLHVSILAPFVLFGVIWVVNAVTGERSRLMGQIEQRASRVVDATTALTRDEITVLKTIGELPTLKSGNIGEMSDTLSSMLSHHPLVNDILVFNTKGERIASAARSAGTEEEAEESELFQEVIRSQLPSVGRSHFAQTGRVAGLPVAPFAVPLRDHDGRLSGVLVAELILSEIQNMTLPGPDPDGSYVFVVDRAGRVISHPNAEAARALRDFKGVPAVSDLISGKQDIEEFVDPIQNVRMLAVYRRAPVTGWGVVSAVPAEMVSSSVARTGFDITVIFATSFIFAVAAAYIVGNRLADKLAILTSAAREFGAGEVGRRVDISSRDEIGTLENSLNVIADRLGNQLAKLEDSSLVLKNTCQDVGTALASSTDVEEVTRLAVLSSARLLGIQNAVGLIAEEGENLRVVKSLGMVPAQVIGQIWPLDHKPSVLGRAMKECRPQQIRDLHSYEGPPDAMVMLGRELGFRTAVAVPMTSLGRCVGAIVLFDDGAPRLIPADEIAKVRKIANEAAMAIEASRSRDELKVSNEQLILGGLRLRTIIESIPDGVVVAEAPSGRITVSNTAADRLLGQKITSEADLHEQPSAYHLYHPEDRLLRDEELPLYQSVVLGERDTKEVLVKRAGEKAITILFSSAPLRDDVGKVVGGVGVFSDISEMKELDRMKDESIYITVHELKSPLTVIRGYAQLLMRKTQGIPGREDEMKWLQAVSEQSGRLTAFVERLLDVSRIQTGKLELLRVPTDLVALSHKVAEQEQITTSIHQIRVNAEVSHLIGSWDKSRLEQVLINLVDNAIKYSPGGGSIDLTVRRVDDEAHVSVQDHGMGIAREDMRRIFGKFYRAQAGKGRPAGLGLGLYISYQTVCLHGGKMWAESELGKGSTFYFALPLNHAKTSD